MYKKQKLLQEGWFANADTASRLAIQMNPVGVGSDDT